MPARDHDAPRTATEDLADVVGRERSPEQVEIVQCDPQVDSPDPRLVAMSEVWLVIDQGRSSERPVPVRGRLHLGRVCAGVAPDNRILIDDAGVSRDHAHVVLEGGRVLLVDHSTNGTRVNGRRVESGERFPLSDGDTVTVGVTELGVRIVAAVEVVEGVETIRAAESSPMVVLVGDVVGYTGLSEVNDPHDVAQCLSEVFSALRRRIVEHGGVVNSYAGDAVFATWDGSSATDAVRAARACHTAVEAMAPTLPLRYADGGPLRIGWGVTAGPISASRPSRGRTVLHGDAINLAFRVSSLAGRDGLPPVLVQADLDLEPAIAHGESFDLSVKGRSAPARVRAVLAEQP